MKTVIYKSVISLSVATLVALLFANLAHAGGPYYINEKTLYSAGGVNYPLSITNNGCYDWFGGTKTCRYLEQDTLAPDTWRWAYTRANMYQIWVYRPYVGQAAARYNWRTYQSGVLKDNWTINVDQSSNKGSWAYLGFADYLPNDKGELRLSNTCVPNYWCGGLNVYWDDLQYNTSP